MPGRFWNNEEPALASLAGLASALPAALILLATVSGCRSDSSPSATGTRSAPSTGGDPGTKTAYESMFRGFHQPGFSRDKWIVAGDVLKSVAGPGVDLITVKKYQDFELELEWKVTEGANSGVLYGVTEETSETYWSGPEYQINDDPHHHDGKTPVTSAGALYDLIPPNDQKRLQPTGEWNRTRIVSRLGHVEHWLIGAKILEYDWDGPTTRALIRQSKFANHPQFMRDRYGHIALQHHGAEVWFRNIKITNLSSPSVPASNRN